jgi:phytoene dehydrogenase-like protein
MYDTVIIGAGHNGLVCASYLAKAGQNVLVVERSGYLGGACITQELVPGFRFSTFAYGAHGPGPKICGDLEIPAEAFHIKRLDPGLVQLFPDGDRIVLWSDPTRMEAELERFGGREVEGYRQYRRWCARADAICADFFLRRPPDPAELRQKWTDPTDAWVLSVLLQGSLWDLISPCFTHEKVRMAFARADDAGPANHPGSALAEFVENASTGLGVRNQAGLLEQGMGEITAVLAGRLQAYGGTIRRSAPVRRILVRADRAVGVELESGETIPARRVVSNADPKRTFLKLLSPGSVAPSFRRAVAAITTRASYSKFLAALSRPPAYRALRSEERADVRMAAAVRIGPSLLAVEECWADAQQGKWPLNPVMSCHLPTAYWPSQAPAGKHCFSAWLRWTPAKLADGSTWEDNRERFTTRILQIFEDYAPGFGASVEWSRLLTPADIERETGITDASIRHVDMTLDQMLNRRPLPAWASYQTPVPGLWLCGSGTHPGGSVTGGPGHNCAAAILADVAHP